MPYFLTGTRLLYSNFGKISHLTYKDNNGGQYGPDTVEDIIKDIITGHTFYLRHGSNNHKVHIVHLQGGTHMLQKNGMINNKILSLHNVIKNLPKI